MQTSRKVLGSNPVNCVGLDVEFGECIAVNTFPPPWVELKGRSLAIDAKTRWLLGPHIRVKKIRQHSDIVFEIC